MKNYSELYPFYDGTVFKNYKVEDILIKRVIDKLNDEEKLLRFKIMEFIIKSERPFNLDADLSEVINEDGCTFSKDEYNELCTSLIEKGSMVIDEEKNVNFIYPVCALPTNHKVTLADGRKFHAMCAVDAMGTAFTFKQDITVNSCCSTCGETVEVEIKDGKVVKFSPENLLVLHVDLNKMSNWSGCC